nr:hypothetical protein [Endozoicomonas sp.]
MITNKKQATLDQPLPQPQSPPVQSNNRFVYAVKRSPSGNKQPSINGERTQLRQNINSRNIGKTDPDHPDKPSSEACPSAVINRTDQCPPPPETKLTKSEAKQVFEANMKNLQRPLDLNKTNDLAEQLESLASRTTGELRRFIQSMETARGLKKRNILQERSLMQQDFYPLYLALAIRRYQNPGLVNFTSHLLFNTPVRETIDRPLLSAILTLCERYPGITIGKMLEQANNRRQLAIQKDTGDKDIRTFLNHAANDYRKKSDNGKSCGTPDARGALAVCVVCAVISSSSGTCRSDLECRQSRVKGASKTYCTNTFCESCSIYCDNHSIHYDTEKCNNRCPQMIDDACSNRCDFIEGVYCEPEAITCESCDIICKLWSPKYNATACFSPGTCPEYRFKDRPAVQKSTTPAQATGTFTELTESTAKTVSEAGEQLLPPYSNSSDNSLNQAVAVGAGCLTVVFALGYYAFSLKNNRAILRSEGVLPWLASPLNRRQGGRESNQPSVANYDPVASLETGTAAGEESNL